MAHSVIGISLVKQSKRDRQMRIQDLEFVKRQHKQEFNIKKDRIRGFRRLLAWAWFEHDTYYIDWDGGPRPIIKTLMGKDDLPFQVRKWKNKWNKKFKRPELKRKF